jgi:protein gp37
MVAFTILMATVLMNPAKCDLWKKGCWTVNPSSRMHEMNRTNIEYCTRSLNPVVGCPHDCPFCYAKPQAKRQKHRCQLCYEFKVHPHLERLKQLSPRQKPQRIFINSMWDWNAIDVRAEWLRAILAKMTECSQHTFLISSKRPKLYDQYGFLYPRNAWLATSIARTEDTYRVHDLHKAVPHNLNYVNVEPLHERIDFWFSKTDWLIVGAETGHRKGKITPDPSWIQDLIDNAKAERIPIFVKNNVGWPVKIQEFPKEAVSCD